MLKFFWSIKSYSTDVGLLLLRIVLGTLMMSHGWDKLMNFADAEKFPDPLGVTGPVSAMLTIFAELICSGFLVLGLFSRAALIPLIFTMLVVIFIVAAGTDLGEREHAILFLVPYISLWLTGPGRYSIDGLLNR